MHSTPPGSDPVFDAVVKMLRDWRQSADACTWSIMSVLLLARPLCPAFHMKEGGEQSATVERDVDAPLAILRIRRRRRRRSPREARRCKQHGDEVTPSIPFLTPLLLELVCRCLLSRGFARSLPSLACRRETKGRGGFLNSSSSCLEFSRRVLEFLFRMGCLVPIVCR